MCFGYRPSEIVQAWLPASLSVNLIQLSLTTCEYISTDVTAVSNPQFRAGRREIVRASNLLLWVPGRSVRERGRPETHARGGAASRST